MKQKSELILQWCSDPECPNYNERLVDKGYGCPVCPSQPIAKPVQEMDAIYLVENY